MIVYNLHEPVVPTGKILIVATHYFLLLRVYCRGFHSVGRALEVEAMGIWVQENGGAGVFGLGVVGLSTCKS